MYSTDAKHAHRPSEGHAQTRGGPGHATRRAHHEMLCLIGCLIAFLNELEDLLLCVREVGLALLRYESGKIVNIIKASWLR